MAILLRVCICFCLVNFSFNLLYVSISICVRYRISGEIKLCVWCFFVFYTSRVFRPTSLPPSPPFYDFKGDMQRFFTKLMKK